MIGCERVFAALDHKEPDRVPIYIWTVSYTHLTLPTKA